MFVEVTILITNFYNPYIFVNFLFLRNDFFMFHLGVRFILMHFTFLR